MVRQFRCFIRNNKARVVPLTVTVMLIAVALGGMFLSFNDAHAYTIDDTPTMFAKTTGRNFHLNSIIQLPNGTLMSVSQNSTLHYNQGVASCRFSHDDGITWTQDTTLSNACKGARAGVMTNGTVIVFLHTSAVDWYSLKYILSYDGGNTWTSEKWFNNIIDNDYSINSNPNYDNSTGNMFVAIYNDSDQTRYIFNSTDNGQTWHNYSIIYSGFEQHYTSVVKLANGSWFCLFANSTTGEGNTATYKCWSEDSMQTWSTPALFDFRVRNPKLEMGSLDNTNPYILFGGSIDDNFRDMHIWNSSDCITWGNNHSISVETPDHRASYSSGVNMKNGDFLLTFSSLYDIPNHRCQLEYVVLHDFGDPPYIIRPWEITNINSINGQTNNAVISDESRTFNWLKVEHGTYYNLQIANDSAFTDIFYNKSDINGTNYGSAFYHEAGNYVYFNISNIYNEGARMGDTHYYRIRAYLGE